MSKGRNTLLRKVPACVLLRKASLCSGFRMRSGLPGNSRFAPRFTNMRDVRTILARKAMRGELLMLSLTQTQLHRLGLTIDLSGPPSKRLNYLRCCALDCAAECALTSRSSGAMRSGVHMRMRSATVLAGVFAFAAAPQAAESSVLRQVQTIPLPNVEGRIDHLGVDVQGQR